MSRIPSPPVPDVQAQLQQLVREMLLVLRERSDDDAIHQVRKQIKRARGLIRLLHSSHGADWAKGVEARLAKAGRALAAVRDSAALLECFDNLVERAPALSPEMSSPLRVSLRRHLEGEADGPRWRQIAYARAWLHDAGRLLTLSVAAPDAGAYRVGAVRTYRRARAAGVAAFEAPSSERLHRWRKHVKHHGHQLQSLGESRRVERRARRLMRLAEVLGDEHDLHVLKLQLERLPSPEPEERSRVARATRVLLAFLKKERARLRKRSLKRGRPLFARGARRTLGPLPARRAR